MDRLIENYKKTKNFHHAYVIEGDFDFSFEKLNHFLENEVKFKTRGNPDFLHVTVDTFGIDEGRELKEMQIKKSFNEGGKKIFVISLNFITREAQNSLLKVFEEPTEDTHFFLLTPSAEIFLPTVRSRMMVLSCDNPNGASSETEALVDKFLHSTPKIRLDLLSKIIEEKNKAEAIEFLNILEKNLFETWSKDNVKNFDTQRKEVFQQIINCRNYLCDRAPSVKMILEHIALVTPVVVR